MSSLDQSACSPEEVELARKRAELTQLDDKYSELELELATLHGQLVFFERKYMSTVGRRYARLDELNASLAEALARQQPENETAQEAADEARKAARRSAEAAGKIDENKIQTEFSPSEQLKQLYRQAAKEIHPDKAVDEADRRRREEAMKRVTAAFEQCDEKTIAALLHDWKMSPDQVEGDDVAANLIKTIRRIEQVKKEIARLKAESKELKSSQLYQFFRKCLDSKSLGRNLLAEMVERLDQEIAAVKKHVDDLAG